MGKFIINNKSSQPNKIAFMVVQQVINKGEPFKVFNDFMVGKDQYVTVVWQPNKDSDRFIIYNDKH